MQKITAQLEDWWYDQFFHVYWGHIYGDRKNRFRDGTRIHTSSVKPKERHKREGDIIETLNSRYLLGAPRDENEH